MLLATSFNIGITFLFFPVGDFHLNSPFPRLLSCVRCVMIDRIFGRVFRLEPLGQSLTKEQAAFPRNENCPRFFFVAFSAFLQSVNILYRELTNILQH